MRLLPAGTASLHAASLLAGLLVVRMLLQLAQNAALLQLHVEALQRAIDRLIRLDGNVNQTLSWPPKVSVWQIFRLSVAGTVASALVGRQSPQNRDGILP